MNITKEFWKYIEKYDALKVNRKIELTKDYKFRIK